MEVHADCEHLIIEAPAALTSQLAWVELGTMRKALTTWLGHPVQEADFEVGLRQGGNGYGKSR